MISIARSTRRLVPLLLCLPWSLAAAADSLPPLAGSPPRNFEELWAGYDPAEEPLEVQIVHQWEKDGITTRMLVYTVGTFKGVKSRMGAFHAFPTRVSGKIPGILHMHGGGQRAQRETVEAAAAHGYSAISINWGGNAMDDQKPGDAGTDWGALDASQTTHNSHYASLQPDAQTLDRVVSPRNSNWFPIIIAARRALTFLQQQAEVDPERLGVQGHSMGGKLTVMTAGADLRVKAAVPSCGGTGDASDTLRARPGAAFRPLNPEPLHYHTIDDLPYLRRITCPILYTGPHNDFNGNLDHLYANWREMPGKAIHFSISPHFNHRHLPESAFAGAHFFDVHLKGEGTFPKTPDLRVELKTADRIPLATLRPDRTDEVVKVEIFYSVDPHALTRFWRAAPATRQDGEWIAPCPVISTEMPLHVMANVFYRLPKPVIGPRWQSKSPETFLVSSWALDFVPSDLQAGGVKATDTTERLIEGDFGAWSDWYQLEQENPVHHQAITRKIKDPKWRGPDGARLAIDVLDPAGGELALTFETNGWSAYAGVKQGSYCAAKPIARTSDWQTIEFALTDLKALDDKSPQTAGSWQFMTELGLVAHARGKAKGGTQPEILVGSPWTSARKLRNLRWVGGEYPKQFVLPGAQVSEEEFRRTFQAEIDKSVQREKRDANQSR